MKRIAGPRSEDVKSQKESLSATGLEDLFFAFFLSCFHDKHATSLVIAEDPEEPQRIWRTISLDARANSGQPARRATTC